MMCEWIEQEETMRWCRKMRQNQVLWIRKQWVIHMLTLQRPNSKIVSLCFSYLSRRSLSLWSFFFVLFWRHFPNHSVKQQLKNIWFFFFWLGKWRPRLRNTFSSFPTAKQDHRTQYWPMLWCWSVLCKFHKVFKRKG